MFVGWESVAIAAVVDVAVNSFNESNLRIEFFAGNETLMNWMYYIPK